ncbi:zinc finger protein 883-like isoform X2 [Thrips palmi]|uniref:Zinc finger protein 883-like isoform X2 n=1 Tax=Thrips palmi TaxID=161013 RepID=A0A6P8ZVX1_THRPL|nr:zinc finger protein 883-like isoform X2 [Thrips palmi]
MEVEILDIGAACRLCLSVSSNHIPIFHESEADFMDPASLPQRIGTCVGFEVRENDDFPSLICCSCLQEVDRWFVFRTQCRNTHELLSKVLVEGCQFVATPVQVKEAIEITVPNESSEMENAVQGHCDSDEQGNHTSTIKPVKSGDQMVNDGKIPSESFDNDDNEANNEPFEIGSASDDDDDNVDDDDVDDDDDDENDFSGDNGLSGETSDDTKWRLKPVSCPICSKSFSKHSGVKTHLRIVHTVLKLYPCLICAHVSCLSSGRIKHIAKRHPEEILKKNTCRICGIRVKTNSSFQRHLRKHASERVCKLCHLELDSIEALIKHKKTVHQHREEPPDGIDHNFFCHHCENVSFWKESDWRAHYLDVHNTEDVFPCNMCDKAFRSKSFRADHMRYHTGEKPFMCEQCASRFSSKHALRNHMRKHTSKFQCDVCNKRYTSNAGLYYHKRTHTGEKPYVCHECGNPFKSHQGLQFHMRIHSGEKPYGCDKCDYTCRTSSALYSHKVSHTDERPFKCDDCGKTFKMKSWLREHKKTHSGVKNFVCEICEHAFIAAYQLRSHMKTHSGERSHVCEFCSKTFARRDTLMEHLRTHTKETKYSCQSCNKDFMFLKQFKKHKCSSSSSLLETVQELTVSSCFDDSD